MKVEFQRFLDPYNLNLKSKFSSIDKTYNILKFVNYNVMLQKFLCKSNYI